MNRHTPFATLLPLFERERAAGRALVLATVIHTAGSTYRKAGAQMLLAADGTLVGLLSGGCLEGDLKAHAQEVLASGIARIVSYDMRGDDDLLFGLGAGCEGAMDILLQRIDATQGWQPLTHLEHCWRAEQKCRYAVVTHSITDGPTVGQVYSFDEDETSPSSLPRLPEAWARILEGSEDSKLQASDGTELFVCVSPAPIRVLVLGAGPDAIPVVKLCDFLGWNTTVYDHRAALTLPERFPAQTRIVTARANELHNLLELNRFDAAVVMSHHLDSDEQYLNALSGATIPYIGLLGPAARRERLFSRLSDAANFKNRLHAPIGLNIGATTPEGIALAIVSEIHAVLQRKEPFGTSNV